MGELMIPPVASGRAKLTAKRLTAAATPVTVEYEKPACFDGTRWSGLVGHTAPAATELPSSTPTVATTDTAPADGAESDGKATSGTMSVDGEETGCLATDTQADHEGNTVNEHAESVEPVTQYREHDILKEKADGGRKWENERSRSRVPPTDVTENQSN